MSKWCVVLVALALLLAGAGDAEATVITIGLGDFGAPVVLDFEAQSAGAISGTDPYFTDAGISSASVTGGVATGDVLTTNVDGNALASVGGGLSIVAPNGALDGGRQLPLPIFAFDLAQHQNKFGATIVDQTGYFEFTFKSAGGTVGSFSYDNSAAASPAESTVYLQSSVAFDRVEISHPGGTGAYGVDNVTLDAIPEPTTLALLSVGVVGQVVRSRRKRRRR